MPKADSRFTVDLVLAEAKANEILEMEIALSETTTRLSALTIVDGQLSGIPKAGDAYNPEQRYIRGDIVTGSDGAEYMAEKPVKGIDPVTATYSDEKAFWLRLEAGYPSWDSYAIDYYFLDGTDRVSWNGANYECKQSHSRNELNAPDTITGKKYWISI